MDDTIIMVELNDACLAHLKFILLCFEAMSGLKINFAKSEVIVTGVTEAEALRVSQLLNCSLGSFLSSISGFPPRVTYYWRRISHLQWLKWATVSCRGGADITLKVERWHL